MNDNYPIEALDEPEITITVVHLATKNEPVGTECWVIESHRDPAAIKYYAGYFFRNEFEEAVRFVRKSDADKVKEQFSQFKAYNSVKHKWL